MSFVRVCDISSNAEGEKHDLSSAYAIYRQMRKARSMSFVRICYISSNAEERHALLLPRLTIYISHFSMGGMFDTLKQ